MAGRCAPDGVGLSQRRDASRFWLGQRSKGRGHLGIRLARPLAIQLLHEAGIRLCLATGTAAVPPWVAQKYPDVLRVKGDGRRRLRVLAIHFARIRQTSGGFRVGSLAGQVVRW